MSQNKSTISLLADIRQLLFKELKIELRQKATLNGTFLYVISTIFVVYLVFTSIDDLGTWIALLWMILLFAATNASINSFRKESSRQFYYYYQLCSPQAIIYAKLIFNALLLLIIAFITYGLFTLLLNNPIENQGLFSLTLLLGSLSISTTLTMVAAIASKTNNNATLTAVLSFPILLPSILTAIKVSMLCGLGFGWEECQIYLLTLLLLNIITAVLSYILFPYLWRS